MQSACLLDASNVLSILDIWLRLSQERERQQGHQVVFFARGSGNLSTTGVVCCTDLSRILYDCFCTISRLFSGEKNLSRMDLYELVLQQIPESDRKCTGLRLMTK